MLGIILMAIGGAAITLGLSFVLITIIEVIFGDIDHA